MSDTMTEGGVTLTLTAEAAVQVRQFFAAENLDETSAALRVSVMPGGCSGFEYALEVDEEAPAEDDYVLESEGIRLFMDPFSGQYLSGVTIGYHSSFQGQGFTFENPNATGSCGCGTSFSV
ncbi:MAG: iron-sulfur cluster assembly accessory protein [marine benthic group bacterium]|nr:iron-sulfur cluster assembly accessory protein [Candidatus Benthicola marisminoris]